MGERDLPAGPRGGKRTTWGLSGNLVTNSTATFSVQTGDLSDSDFKYYTVSFGVTAPQNNQGFQAQAQINFVVNGVPITRKVTIGQAMEISGPADSISVIVSDSTPTAWTNAGQAYSVSVTIAPGTRTSLTRALLTDTGGNFSVGAGVYQITSIASVFPNVPQNAGVDGVYISLALIGAANQVRVDQSTGGGDLVSTTQIAIANSTQQAFIWLPILPGVAQLTLSMGGGGTIEVTLVWTIVG